MSLPYMSDKSMMRDVVRRQFGGLNNNLSAGDGEIVWMENMSSREYPLLATRNQRGLEYELTNPVSMGAQDIPFWIDGENFYYGESVKGQVSSGTEKKFAVMGSKVLIFPDKLYYDFKLDEFGSMEPGKQITGLEFRNGEISGVPAYANTIYKSGAAWQFSVGDAVKISGCVKHPENNKTAIVREVDGDYLRFYEDTFVLNSPVYAVPAEGLLSGTYHFEYGQFVVGRTKTVNKPTFQDGKLQGISKPANTIYKSGAAWAFKAGETVTITGCAKHPENNKTAVVREVSGNYLRFDENTFSLDYDLVFDLDSPLPLGWYKFKPYGNDIFGSFLVEFTPIPAGAKLKYDDVFGSVFVIYPETLPVEEMAVYGVTRGTELAFYRSYKKYTESGNVIVTSASASLAESAAAGATLAWNGQWLEVADRGNSYQLPVTEGDSGTALIFADLQMNYTEDVLVSISRDVPDLDYICVNENRLWGCKGDTIYASALGKPFNFNVFDGLSTDSWQSDTTDAGDFTGCVSYQGYPIFFKEDSVFKVQGDGATNFAWTRTSRFGIKQGCYRSLAVAGETLFYLSRVGVCAYHGGMPVLVSGPLGDDTKWMRVSAGSDGLRYYLNVFDGSKYSLYVYDTRYRLWHREATGNALSFAFWDSGLHVLYDNGEIWRLDGREGDLENAVTWSVVFADSTRFFETTDTGSQAKKGPLRILIRGTLETGTSVNVMISYDDGEDTTVGTLSGSGKKQTYVLPLTLRRCDHYRISLAGEGDALIYSLSIEKYNGSPFQGTGSVN